MSRAKPGGGKEDEVSGPSDAGTLLRGRHRKRLKCGAIEAERLSWCTGCVLCVFGKTWDFCTHTPTGPHSRKLEGPPSSSPHGPERAGNCPEQPKEQSRGCRVTVQPPTAVLKPNQACFDKLLEYSAQCWAAVGKPALGLCHQPDLAAHCSVKHLSARSNAARSAWCAARFELVDRPCWSNDCRQWPGPQHLRADSHQAIEAEHRQWLGDPVGL